MLPFYLKSFHCPNTCVSFRESSLESQQREKESTKPGFLEIPLKSKAWTSGHLLSPNKQINKRQIKRIHQMRPLFESQLGLQCGAKSLGSHTTPVWTLLFFLLGWPPPPILLQTVPLPVNEKRGLVAARVLFGLNILSLQGSFLALAAFWTVCNKALFSWTRGLGLIA